MKNAAHLSYCHCCELCALKQKPGVLLEKNTLSEDVKTLLMDKNKTKSRLQTVLITASGPQAFNALVHRERYTQGSRQNRCVSSQDALALRANAKGTGVASACKTQCRFIMGVAVSAVAPVLYDVAFVSVYYSEASNLLPLASWRRQNLPGIANSELLTAGNPTV